METDGWKWSINIDVVNFFFLMLQVWSFLLLVSMRPSKWRLPVGSAAVRTAHNDTPLQSSRRETVT